jgi:hypothetical protein
MSGRPFHEAFAEALTRRRVSLAWLHHRLSERGRPVSVTALSYWRSGRSQPERGTSLDAVDEIERILGVTPRSLSSLIGPSRRPGPKQPEMTPEEVFASTPGIQPVLSALGFTGLSDEMTEHIRHITADIDASGRTAVIQARTMMRARHDGARRTPMVLSLDDAGRAPAFASVAGCSIGRQKVDQESGVFGIELLLDRELEAGQTHLFEVHVTLPEPSTDNFFEHFSARRLAELLIWVRFDPSRLPTKVESYVQNDDGEVGETVLMGSGTTAHAMERGFGPGILGIRWEW